MAERGRPKAPDTITEEVINIEDLTKKSFVLQDIQQITCDIECTIVFLASVGLIHNSVICCNQPMSFVNREKCADGKAWHCTICKCYRSIRQNSFFSGSRIRLPRLVELIYWWTEIDCKQTFVMEKVGLGTEAIVKWYNYFRDICAMWCVDNPVKIGGDGVVVEIDESQFMHREYHRSCYQQGHWIVGMVERHSLKSVLVPVPDRNAATLLPIILDHLLPGTCIVTEGSDAYQKLADRYSDNHRLHFVEPNDKTLQANTIESTWSNIKDKYRAMHRTSDNLFSTYLQEFSWRRDHKDNVFMAFISCIRHYYPM